MVVIVVDTILLYDLIIYLSLTTKALEVPQILQLMIMGTNIIIMKTNRVENIFHSVVGHKPKHACSHYAEKTLRSWSIVDY